jgi:hypothetical protein
MHLNMDYKITLTGAAVVLQALRICKAYGLTGKINGPNCYRFGHRDSVTGRWWWDTSELVNEARRRGTASEEEIQSVIRQLAMSERPQMVSSPTTVSDSLASKRTQRASMEIQFRESLLRLESSLRGTLGINGRDTFGVLIAKAEKKKAYSRHQVAELSFINAVRNSLFHPTGENVDDRTLSRAIAAIEGWITALR